MARQTGQRDLLACDAAARALAVVLHSVAPIKGLMLAPKTAGRPSQRCLFSQSTTTERGPQHPRCANDIGVKPEAYVLRGFASKGDQRRPIDVNINGVHRWKECVVERFFVSQCAERRVVGVGYEEQIVIAVGRGQRVGFRCAKRTDRRAP